MKKSFKESSLLQFVSFMSHFRFTFIPVLILILITFAISLGIAFSPYLSKLLFDKVFLTMDIYILFKVLGIWLFVLVYLTLLMIFYIVLESHLSISLGNSIKTEYLKILSRTQLQFFLDNDIGFIGKRVIEDSSIIADGLCKCFKIGLNIIMIIVITFLISTINKWFCNIYISLVLLSFIWMAFWMFPVHKINVRIGNGYSSIYSIILEAIQGVKDIKLNNLEYLTINRLSQNNRILQNQMIKSSAYNTLLWQFTTLFYYIGYGSILVLGLKKINEGNISTGMLIGFLSFISYFFDPIQQIYRSIGNVQSGIAAAKRIQDIKNSPLEKSGRIDIFPFKNDITFENVSVSFQDKIVLNQISFSIKKGTNNAIVGVSGSGKSTIINLLLKLFDHYTGTILIDGKDLRNLNTDQVRKSIIFISQEIQLFNDTIRNNIDIEGIKTDSEIEDILELVNLKPLIESLKNGIETEVADGGINFSGGEKQRIAIARCLAVDPEIIIFDEITSALDTNNEKIILNNLFSHFKNKTTISISHRIDSIRKCDSILVLKNGVLVEQGNHNDLILQNGEYCRNFLYKESMVTNGIIAS